MASKTKSQEVADRWQKERKAIAEKPAAPQVEWQILPAPRDKVVWMFLPCSKFEADTDGRPKGEVGHEVVLGEWNKDIGAWVQYQHQPYRQLYPSMWALVVNPSVVPAPPSFD